MQDAYPERADQPDLTDRLIRVVGTGATAPTKVYGAGVTIGRTGVGVYTLTYAEDPGNWIGTTTGLSATTASGVKGYTVVTKYVASVITVSLFDSTFAAVDLAAAQWLTVRASFARNSATA